MTMQELMKSAIQPGYRPPTQHQFSFSTRSRIEDTLRAEVPSLKDASERDCMLWLAARGYAKVVGEEGPILPPILRSCDLI